MPRIVDIRYGVCAVHEVDEIVTRVSRLPRVNSNEIFAYTVPKWEIHEIFSPDTRVDYNISQYRYLYMAIYKYTII